MTPSAPPWPVDPATASPGPTPGVGSEVRQVITSLRSIIDKIVSIGISPRWFIEAALRVQMKIISVCIHQREARAENKK